MALNDYKITKVNSGFLFIGKTDFDKGRKYQEVDYYVYEKGWFRTANGSVVVKIHAKKPHLKDSFHYCSTLKEALNFVKCEVRK